MALTGFLSISASLTPIAQTQTFMAAVRGAALLALSIFSRPLTDGVRLHVLCVRRKQLKVFKAIIRLVAIDMMNRFTGKKISTKVMLHNQSVFQNIWSAINCWMVGGVPHEVAGGSLDLTLALASLPRTESSRSINTGPLEGLPDTDWTTPQTSSAFVQRELFFDVEVDSLAVFNCHCGSPCDNKFTTGGVSSRCF